MSRLVALTRSAEDSISSSMVVYVAVIKWLTLPQMLYRTTSVMLLRVPGNIMTRGLT